MVKPKKTKQKQSSSELLGNAQKLALDHDVDSALELLRQALSKQPNNAEIMEYMAELLLEAGKLNDAERICRKCMELRPNVGYAKYFMMGQMELGQKSVDYFRKGIKVAYGELKRVHAENDGDKIKEDISQALCSIAEVYMTDLMNARDAENHCISAMKEALSLTPHSIQCLLTFSNLKVHQGDIQEAKKALLLLLQQKEKLGQSTYDFRLSLCKILIEVELYDMCTELLAELKSEDEESFDLWYVSAVNCKYQRKYIRAVNYFTIARMLASDPEHQNVMMQEIEECLAMAGKGSGDVTDDDEIVDHEKDENDDMEDED